MPENIIDNMNVAISVVTNIACIYIVITMSYWWWALRFSTTNLRPLILGIAVAKAGIWFWTFSQIVNIWFRSADLPLWSMPARIMIMIAALVQVWVTFRIKPATKIDNVPDPFR